MRSFEYHRVTSVAQAIALLAKYGEKAAVLGGGTDLLGLMKDGLHGPKLRTPEHLIAVKWIAGLSKVEDRAGGVRLGANATVDEVATSELVVTRFPAVAQAAKAVAVPQIRSLATVGGNLCQRPRCWYFRGKLFDDCLRKGGGSCYAPGGENQYHAVLGGGTCNMVYPSDLAPALIASGAKIDIAGPKGNRQIPLEQFYVTPEKNVLRENVLAPGELVVSVELPKPAAETRGVYLKLKERQAFDFAVTSVAAVATVRGGALLEPRIVFGGLAPYPFRARKSEQAAHGRPLKECLTVACGAATAGAQPLSQNAYKVAAAKGLLEQALASLV